MRILIAPDKFKFALDAASVTAAMAAGVYDVSSDADVRLCPLADGGEGSGVVLAEALTARAESIVVLDPCGRPRQARWWTSPDGSTAIIETAEAAGLALLALEERNPLHTTTCGVGQLIAAAQAARCTRALVCVGGSATVDGGAGCLQTLGAEYLDSYARVFDEPVTGGDLQHIREVRIPPGLCSIRLKVLCDVSNPLLGPLGAARVFGPQKGALPDDVEVLEHGLAHWAELLRTTTKRDVRMLPGGGAAGGLPAGLYAACRAQLVNGFAEIASAANLEGLIDGCDLCLTGEGRIDTQTSAGKVVAGVADLAAKRGVPVIALVGAAEPPQGCSLDEFARRLGLARIIKITPDGTPIEEARRATAANLRRAAAGVLSQ